MSERLWKDAISEALVESSVADWSEDDSNDCRKIDVHSGKNITQYSFRHIHITLRLNAGTPVAVVAANCDTSMKYIEEHYLHNRTAEQTEILGEGRRTLGKAGEHLDWIEELQISTKQKSRQSSPTDVALHPNKAEDHETHNDLCLIKAI